MTQRIVWLMGVAAVATMVILAGCGDGPGAAPTDPAEPTDPPAQDYAAALVGTWTATANALTDPAVPASEVQYAITAMIEAGDMANMGNLTLDIVPTLLITMQQGDPFLVTGDIAVDAAAITVTITAVEPSPDPADPTTTVILAALAEPQTLTYTLSEDGNMLTVGSALFAVLLAPTVTEITLTKGMASS